MLGQLAGSACWGSVLGQMRARAACGVTLLVFAETCAAQEISRASAAAGTGGAVP